MLPAVALRGITILPGMIAHFDISREVSIKAVERAMKDGDSIFLVTQKDTNKENPEIEDLQSIGVIAEIKQVVRLQNDIIRVMVEGEQRAEVYEIAQDQQLPLAADEGDCSGHGAGGQFFFCFHGITPPRTS